MIKLERISLADVEPDENNPRKKFEGLKELAASFDANAEKPGEPFIPISVVKDGGRYRIVDGERRWRAMNLAKTKECDALVAETMEDEAAMIAMIATDDKQRLTDAELSHGVQQMLLLGVDPVKIEKSAKLKKGSAKKLKKAAELAEGAEQMGIDRLLAIAEFEGDEEAVKALSECSEDRWRDVAYRIKAEREKTELAESLKEAFEAGGVEVVEERPIGYRYECCLATVESIAAHLDDNDIPEDAKAVISMGWRVEAVLLFPAEEDEPDPEEEERKRIRDSHIALYEQGKERRIKWIANKVARPTDEMPHISELIENDGDRFGYELDGLFEIIPKDSDIPAGPREIVRFVWKRETRGNGLMQYWTGTDLGKSACSQYIELIDLLKLEGYEPDEGEAAIYDEAKAALEEAETEESE